jgi:hypothetical protein
MPWHRARGSPCSSWSSSPALSVTSLKIAIFGNNLTNSNSGNLTPINLFQLEEWGQSKSIGDLCSNRHAVPEEVLNMEWYLAQEGWNYIGNNPTPVPLCQPKSPEINLGLNLGLCSQKPATNCLSYSKVHSSSTFCLWLPCAIFNFM